MTAHCQLAQRTLLRAFRAGEYVLILAEGELPTPGFEVDIEQSPLRIVPPQFNLGSPDVSVGRDHAAVRPGRGGQRPPRVSSAMAMRDSGLRP